VPSTDEPESVDDQRALDWLARDGLVAFPTETVWGLGARAGSAEAMARLRRFKGRDGDKPVALLVDAPERLHELGVELSPAAARLVAAFWPGPLTLVARCPGPFAPGVAGPDLAVGFRCSPHPVAAALAAGAFARGLGPMTATSLNRSGEPPARDVAEARRVVRVGAGVLLARGEAGGAEPSTVVDATGATPVILREGAIPRGALRAVLEARPEAEMASR